MTFLYMTILFLATVVVIGSTVFCVMRLTVPNAKDEPTLQKLGKTGDKVVGAYKKIESGTVGTYKKIEDGVVGGYTKIEDKFVDSFLTREGETIAEAKQRLRGE